jgi:hypothetical protein
MVREAEMVEYWGLSLSLVLALLRYLLDYWDVRARRREPPHEPQVGLFFLVVRGEDNTNMLSSLAMPLRACIVSFKDTRGIRHSVEVEAESLYEAAVLGVRRLNNDAWIEKIGPATVVDIEIREPATTHSMSLQQVERWLAGATTNPNEAMKKAKLLVKR